MFLCGRVRLFKLYLVFLVIVWLVVLYFSEDCRLGAVSLRYWFVTWLIHWSRIILIHQMVVTDPQVILVHHSCHGLIMAFIHVYCWFITFDSTRGFYWFMTSLIHHVFHWLITSFIDSSPLIHIVSFSDSSDDFYIRNLLRQTQWTVWHFREGLGCPPSVRVGAETVIRSWM